MKFLHRLLLTLAAVTAAVYALGALANFDYLAAVTRFGGVGLFFISAVSSSIFFVFSSEAIVVAATKFLPPLDIVLFATAGSVFGAVVNYWVGLRGIHRLIGDDSRDERRAEKWFARWGEGIVFFASVIPFAGDVLTVVAGILEMDFAKFVLYSVAGRAVKIVLLVLLGQSLLALVHW